MNKQTVEDYANNLFHPFKETAIIKRSDVIKTLNKAIQQERKEIVEYLNGREKELQEEIDNYACMPHCEYTATRKYEVRKIRDHLNNK